MKYMGSKNRIAKEIVDVILENEYNLGKKLYFFEPFCGGLHVSQRLIEKLNRLGVEVEVLASDANVYLTSLWEVLKCKGLKHNLPREISKDYYSEVRTEYNKLRKSDKSVVMNLSIEERATIGWVSLVASAKGRGFSGGYSGKYENRDYIDESIRNIEKQITSSNWLESVVIDTDNPIGYEYYDNLDKGYIIYCDIPYRDTTPYEFSSGFNHEKFYEWCVRMTKKGHPVYVSEYNIPDERFEIVWERNVKVAMENEATHNRCERLYRVKV